MLIRRRSDGGATAKGKRCSPMSAENSEPSSLITVPSNTNLTPALGAVPLANILRALSDHQSACPLSAVQQQPPAGH